MDIDSNVIMRNIPEEESDDAHYDFKVKQFLP
jgi:hypothetical protein